MDVLMGKSMLKMGMFHYHAWLLEGFQFIDPKGGISPWGADDFDRWKWDGNGSSNILGGSKIFGTYLD